MIPTGREGRERGCCIRPAQLVQFSAKPQSILSEYCSLSVSLQSRLSTLVDKELLNIGLSLIHMKVAAGFQIQYINLIRLGGATTL